MSAALVESAYRTSLGSQRAKAVLVALAQTAKGEGRVTISVGAIARRTELDLAEVWRELGVLEAAGLIVRVSSLKEHGYWLNVHRLERDQRHAIATARSAPSLASIGDLQLVRGCANQPAAAVMPPSEVSA